VKQTASESVLKVGRDVSEAEWAARVDLAAFYRIVDQLGMTDVIYNHITLKVPDAEGQFLINPLGLHYSEVTASNLVKIDLDGNILQSASGAKVNRPGFVIHSAIHAARHDIACIAHTHTVAGLAVASTECGLLPLNQNALRFWGDIAYHDYEGPVLHPEEQARIVADLGSRNTLILRNHGLLVCGIGVAETYLSLWCLETACRMQVAALSCGQPLVMPDEKAIAQSEVAYGMLRKRTARMEWDAARRLLDRQCTDYQR
jgi:ribulose-5-phosphate 4-epimerase/fuculose-1-phosphate aldolase